MHVLASGGLVRLDRAARKMLLAGAPTVILLLLVWLRPVHAVDLLPPSLSEIATIPIGAAPREIVVDASHGRAYIANSGSGSIAVLNTESLTVENRWPLYGAIRTMALDPTTGRLYVTYDVGDHQTEVWSMDAETGVFQQGIWLAMSAGGLDVDTRTHRAYLAGTLGGGGVSRPKLVA